MKSVNCPCPGCGTGLSNILAWLVAVADRPVELPYRGPWGLEAKWEVGGVEVLDVMCPRCGSRSAVGRDCPVASA